MRDRLATISLERIPPPRFDEFQLPTLAFGWYDVVLAFDHLQHRDRPVKVDSTKAQAGELPEAEPGAE